MNYVTDDIINWLSVPEQIDARMLVYIKGYAPVAEFPLRIGWKDLANEYYFDFETTTTAHNGLQSAIEAQFNRKRKFVEEVFNGQAVIKIGIVHKGLLVEVLRLERGKLLPACWFSVQTFPFV